ncbi:lysosome-associated membrane glycoprotein 1a [Paramormyrops kingsleyae]|uniref:Lysosome-associated membrane glycoprotein 1 n=1 Tax=Paramormyrops kingsleyae TaxID=1676925 RepID=A0A3B3S9Z9_9TELE|nr:lysosome-associated membrane glycoprotein 1 [Paramormyrops kingsleyae]
MASYASKQLLSIAIIFFCALGHLTSAQIVTLEVKEGNSTCIKAELVARFSVAYNTTNGTRTVTFPFPGNATVGNRSSCGGTELPPLLAASFGDGHALILRFSINGSQYRVESLALEYNLNDSSIFPNSSSPSLVTVKTDSAGILAQINTTYRCESSWPVSLGGGSGNASGNASVTFSNMRLQAYMLGSDLSRNETVCTADQSVTTVAPKTSPVTPAPVPTVPGNPERGNYNVTNNNGTICLMAYMGLQLNLTYPSSVQNKTVQEVVNLQPNQTKSSGSCEVSNATLQLRDDRTNLTFSFTLNTTSNKYHLSGISITATWPDMKEPFSASNGSLDYLRGTLGRSYLCSAEQTLVVDQTFAINTFHLQVQPFGVNGGQFEAAEECQLDEDNMLIPIIVGAALAGLVLIVLIAYLIGRKRSHAGYQTI